MVNMKDKFGFGATLGLAGMSTGMALVGDALPSSGLQSAATTSVKFVPVAANIGVGSYLIKQLKGMKGGKK